MAKPVEDLIDPRRSARAWASTNGFLPPVWAGLAAPDAQDLRRISQFGTVQPAMSLDSPRRRALEPGRIELSQDTSLEREPMLSW